MPVTGLLSLRLCHLGGTDDDFVLALVAVERLHLIHLAIALNERLAGDGDVAEKFMRKMTES